MEDNMFIRRIFCIQRPVSRKMNCLSDKNTFNHKVSVLSGGFLSCIVIFLVLQMSPAVDGYNIRSTSGNFLKSLLVIIILTTLQLRPMRSYNIYDCDSCTLHTT